MTILDEVMDAAGGISGHEGNLQDPQWACATLVHDWRNHVPEVVKSGWDRLPLEARGVAYLHARIAANAEEWD